MKANRANMPVGQQHPPGQWWCHRHLFLAGYVGPVREYPATGHHPGDQLAVAEDRPKSDRRSLAYRIRKQKSPSTINDQGGHQYLW